MYRLIRWLLRKFGYELVTLKHVEECELCKSKHIEMLNAQRKRIDEYAKQLQIYDNFFLSKSGHKRYLQNVYLSLNL